MASPDINRHHDSGSRNAITLPEEKPRKVGDKEAKEIEKLAADMSPIGSKDELEASKLKLLTENNELIRSTVTWGYALMIVVVIFSGIGFLDVHVYVQVALVAGVTGTSATRLLSKFSESLANTTFVNHTNR